MGERMNAETERRREALAVLAMAPADELLRLWGTSGLPDDAESLRGPETGLVALKGRIGGGGAPFNFGEATVTRASVRLPSGETGHAYALGRDGEKVRLAATIDALGQRPEHAKAIEARILQPLREAAAEHDATRRAEAAATKVDFFTMVRGED